MEVTAAAVVEGTTDFEDGGVRKQRAQEREVAAALGQLGEAQSVHEDDAGAAHAGQAEVGVLALPLHAGRVHARGEHGAHGRAPGAEQVGGRDGHAP